MALPDLDSPLAFAVSLAEAVRPRREVLELGDGYRTVVYVYSPADGPGRRLPVVYLHGIQSHPGWFCRSAAALAAAGHAVFQVTRRGSGENREARGHADSAKQLLDDVACACRFALDTTGADGVHLLGVSWGGKLAAAFVAGGADALPVASVTMVAPGIAPQVSVLLGTKLLIAAALVAQPRKLFDIPLNREELFTDNEAMRQYLRDDPCRLYRATARFLYVSRSLDAMLRRAPDGAITVRTTLMLASRDRIIDNAATRRIVQRLAGAKAMVEEFDAAHTIEFEPDPEPFFAALCELVQRQ